MQNENFIHPTAIIGPSVKLGEGNRIGPYTVIDGEVQIGDHNIIDSSVIMTNCVRIGSHNRIYPFVTIGHMGEMGYKGDRLVDGGTVEIGNHSIIREFVNIHSPVRTNLTRVGNHCYIMNKCYLAHDVKIGDHTSLTAGTKLAGRAEVGAFVNMGMGSAVHQRIHVGEGAMVGMNAAVIRHIPPYSIVAGVPARILGFNRMAALRKGYQDEEIEEVRRAFRDIILSRVEMDHEIAVLIRNYIRAHPENLLIDFK